MTTVEIIQAVISQTWAVSIAITKDYISEEEAKHELTKIAAQAVVRIESND